MLSSIGIGQCATKRPMTPDPLWTIFTLAAIVLTAVWAYIYYKPRRATSRAERQDKKNDVEAIDIMQRAQSGRVNSLHHQDNSDNNPKNGDDTEQDIVRAIEPIEWWTGVLAVATVLASIFAGFTLNAIRGQLDEMHQASIDARRLDNAATISANAASDANKLNRDIFIADYRPWIAITNISLLRTLSYDAVNKAIDIDLRFDLKNTGRSPARYVTTFPYVTLNFSMVNQELEKNCGTLRRNASPYGTVIFPGEAKEPADNITISVTHEQIINSQGGNANRKFIHPWIFGCIDYRFMFSEEHHQTRFIIWLNIDNGALIFDPTTDNFPDIPIQDSGFELCQLAGRPIRATLATTNAANRARTARLPT